MSIRVSICTQLFLRKAEFQWRGSLQIYNMFFLLFRCTSVRMIAFQAQMKNTPLVIFGLARSDVFSGCIMNEKHWRHSWLLGGYKRKIRETRIDSLGGGEREKRKISSAFI